MANNMVLTDDQFQVLLTRMVNYQPMAPRGSFTNCTARFKGETNDKLVDAFVNTVIVYKEAEHIEDEDAITGFPLLLEGPAGTWWQGIKEEIRTWPQAIQALRDAYAPRTPNYKNFQAIFDHKQQRPANTDLFVSEKRAAISRINGIIPGNLQLDMVYGLLHLEIRAKVSRANVNTFEELVTLAREAEAILREDEQNTGERQNFKARCTFCKISGHKAEECRKKRLATPATNNVRTGFQCYGCGRPNTTRSRCPTCNNHRQGNISTVQQRPDAKRPHVFLDVNGKPEYALMDTGAEINIASMKLYEMLKRAGNRFHSQEETITLANGIPKRKTVLTTQARVGLNGKEINATFSVLADSRTRETILGTDFLEEGGIILNMPQRTWTFLDEPSKQFDTTRPKHQKERQPPLADLVEEAPFLFPSSPKKIAPTAANYFIYQPQGESMDISTVELRRDEAEHLNEQERTRFNTMLRKQEKAFETNKKPTTLGSHRINTQDNYPVSAKPYRMSPGQRAELEQQVIQLIQDDIIQPSNSPWASPVVLVPKKDGSTRLCVDYRALNKITVGDAYPLPRMDDLLNNGSRSRYVSTIDLKAGYWQVPVNPADVEKTAFTCPFGLFEFKRMPFGLRNAPATFQRIMDRFRTTLPEIKMLTYLDDIIIFSETFEQHMEDLQQVFQQLNQVSLSANRVKTHLCAQRIKYLGHIILPEGIATDPDQVSAIQGWTTPKNKKEAVSFIQTCAWYRRFIPNFAEETQPITKLFKKSATWTWTEIQEAAMSKLKQLLTTSPILRPAVPGIPFTVRTDASDYALGAVLVQGEGPEEHPVEYASRLLTGAERNYTTTEREALAIIWALSKFRGYIEGSPITVSTDHQALRWLMSLKSPTGRLARWALQLQPYDITIKYIPGRANVIADALSRPVWDSSPTHLSPVQINLPQRNESDLREGQKADEALSKIIQALEDTPRTEDAVYWSNKGYFLERGVLYRYHPEIAAEDAQQCIPRTEVDHILEEFHNSPTAGHYGVIGTFHRIAQRYFWKGMRNDVAKYLKNCLECQKYKATNLKPAGLLQTSPSQQRFETISFDLFGPLPISEDGYTTILIVEDIASKWVELFPLKAATATACATTLLNEVFLRFGIPRSCISDNGTQFVSAVMQKVMFSLGIKHNFTPFYHPQANPVERKNRDMKLQLAILVQDKHNSWPTKLPAIRFAMNTHQCSSTGHSAAYLTFGRELRAAEDVLRDLRAILPSENFIAEISPHLQQLADTLEDSRRVMDEKQDSRKKQADNRRRPAPDYVPGDHVWVATHLLSNRKNAFSAKLIPKRDGPYIILKQQGTTTYEVAAMDDPTVPVGTYHVSTLTPFSGMQKKFDHCILSEREEGHARSNDPKISGYFGETPSAPEGESVTKRPSRAANTPSLSHTDPSDVTRRGPRTTSTTSAGMFVRRFSPDGRRPAAIKPRSTSRIVRLVARLLGLLALPNHCLLVALVISDN